MNYKNVHKYMGIAMFISVVVIILSLILSYFYNQRFISIILMLVGMLMILICLPIKIYYWNCPYCRVALPWSLKKGKYKYRCVSCGKDIEL